MENAVKTIVKESHRSELARLKKKEEEEEEEEQRLSGSVLLRCFVAPLGVLFITKTLKDER